MTRSNGEALRPGATLARSRIIERIGAGGMGEVYRTHDLDLDRDVAIKVLPANVAGSDERVRRFHRRGEGRLGTESSEHRRRSRDRQRERPSIHRHGARPISEINPNARSALSVDEGSREHAARARGAAENRAALPGEGSALAVALGLVLAAARRCIFCAATRGTGGRSQSAEGGKSVDLWSLDRAGMRRRLRSDPSPEFSPSVPRAGDVIYYQRETQQRLELWSMNARGGMQRLVAQLPAANGDLDVSPDGRFVVIPTATKLVRVATADGARRVLLEGAVTRATYSPDGRTIAACVRGETLSNVIIDAESGAIRHELAAGSEQQVGELEWTPDGRALIVAENRDGADNLWLHPPDGGKARPLTRFHRGGDRIVSNDGGWEVDLSEPRNDKRGRGADLELQVKKVEDRHSCLSLSVARVHAERDRQECLSSTEATV